MKTTFEDSEELFDDVGLTVRLEGRQDSLPEADLSESPSAERNGVKTVLFDAKDIILGGIGYLREHPVGSIEVGSAIAASGVVLGAVAFRPRHAH
jgi:hypothetical protein